jgi:hypothetical protein
LITSFKVSLTIVISAQERAHQHHRQSEGEPQKDDEVLPAYQITIIIIIVTATTDPGGTLRKMSGVTTLKQR